jgi:hypothetical protein
MKKCIVLSVNDNIDYLYFTPLTCWAWQKIGWEPIVFFHGDVGKGFGDICDLTIDMKIPMTPAVVSGIDGYRSDTITQISRLYGGACVICKPNDYFMTGDIDMLPLSDYWKPDFEKVTVWGHDLTGYGHYPICYIGMNSAEWRRVMNVWNSDYNFHIKRDLDTLPQAKDPDFYKYWFSDQDLITARLNEYGKEKITFVNRGKNPKHTDYAFGRVDRGCWSLDHEQLIDAHLEQQTWQNDAKVARLMELLRHVWLNEDFTWFEKYTIEFRKLAV